MYMRNAAVGKKSIKWQSAISNVVIGRVLRVLV
jgi:hypothetical protein